MGDAVFKLFATLGLDTSEYDKSLDDSESKGSKFGKGLKTAAGVAVGAIAAVTAGTVAGTKAFINGVSSVARYGDNIDKMSQKLNMSATSYQEWDFVMQHAGTSIESMQAGIKTLSNAVESGNKAFERLGITEDQIASMSSEELFSATITALQGVEDETERTYLASQLLGRGATELGPLLNMSAEELADMKKQAHDLGGVLSDDAVKNSARFTDSLQNMKTAFGGMKNSMLSNFLPSFATVMDGLALVFSGDSKGGLGIVKDGVKNLANNITKVAPLFIEVGGTILTSLATSITDNLPLLIESGLNAVGTFVDGVLDNIDGIIDAAEKVISTFADKLLDPSKAKKLTQTAINIIVKIAKGLTEALPQLIPAIAEIIVAIVTTLTQPDNLSMLIQGAITLIMALVDGLIKAIPILISVIPEITVNVTMAIIENFPLILETVLQLLGMLAVGVLDALASLMGTSLEEVMSGLSYGKNLLTSWGSGVLSWLRDIGKSIISNVTNVWTSITGFFTNGIENIKSKVQAGLDNVKSKFTSIFDNVKNTVKGAIDFLKGLFKFDWQLPKIKLPHFSISGKFSLNPPSIPTFKVSWYKKAYEEPYLLNGATIFGAMNGNLLGGGERGSELVVGTNKLMSMIKKASGGQRPINIVINAAEGQDIRALAKEVGKELQNILSDEDDVYA